MNVKVHPVYRAQTALDRPHVSLMLCYSGHFDIVNAPLCYILAHVHVGEVRGNTGLYIRWAPYRHIVKTTENKKLTLWYLGVSRIFGLFPLSRSPDGALRFSMCSFPTSISVTMAFVVNSGNVRSYLFRAEA